MAKPINAKFGSTCNKCKETYPPGTQIFKWSEGWGHYPSCPPTDKEIDKAADAWPVEKTPWDNEEEFLDALAQSHTDAEAVADTADISEENLSPSALALLDQINAQVAELEKKISAFRTSIEPLNREIQEATETERAIWEEAQKKIQEQRAKKAQAQTELNEIHDLIALSQGEIDKLQRDKAAQLEAIAAQERLDALKSEINEIIDSCAWKDDIKPYQMEDVSFIVHAFDEGRSGVLNANPMGLGKTFESIASLDILDHLFYKKYGRKPRVLWLTKKSLMRSTSREVKRWSPDRVVGILEGNPQLRQMIVEMSVANNYMLIANYDALHSTPALRNVEWDIIFADEVHKLKGGALSTPTQIWQQTRALLGIENKGTDHFPRWVRTRDCFFVPLSGSPVQNKPEEVWSYLHLFDPLRFPSVRVFKREYFDQYSGTVRLDQLLNILQGQIIRQDPDEVGVQRPDKYHEYRMVEMTPNQRVLYDKALAQVLKKYADSDEQINITSFLAKLTRCWQIAVWPPSIKVENAVGKFTDEGEWEFEDFNVELQESAKIDEAMEIVEEILGEGEQVVVWSARFNAPLYEIQRRVQALGYSCEVIDGSTKDVEAVQDRFQQGITRVVAVNRVTGGEGLNLQKSKKKWPGGARHAIFLDLWYNPMSNQQCEDRIWRVDSDPESSVTIHIIQAEDSIDQFIAEILAEKEEMVDSIMQDKRLRPASEWVSLLMNSKKKKGDA